MRERAGSTGALPLAALKRIEDACERFEAAWRGDVRPSIRDYLGEAAGAERRALIRELLMLDLPYRVGAGDLPATDDYEELRGDVDEVWLAGAVDALAALPADQADRQRRCQINELVWTGGMAEVYRGWNFVLGRVEAVKTPLKKLGNDPEVRRRFVREAKIGAALNHPGVLPIYELGELADGRPYITMPLLEGDSLSTLLKERPEPSHDLLRFVTIFQDVCQTIAYAHSQTPSVVHRDLTPSNILIAKFGQTYVIDWGLSKSLKEDADEEAHSSNNDDADPESATAAISRDAEQTAMGSTFGTPGYMSPEQASGEVGRIDKRSDVFGLGAILCAILTGHPPYRDVGVPPAERSLDDAFRRLETVADDELAALAKRCLSPRPEDRPVDANEVAQTLEEYLARAAQRLREAEHAAIASAAEARAAETRLQHERRTRRVIGVSLAVIAAVLVLLGFYAWASRVSKRELARRGWLEQQIAIRQGAHSADWSTKALGFATSANDLESTPDLREPVAAALAGIDAKLTSRREGLGVSGIAWSADGKTLLLGGADDRRGKPSHEARIWNVGSDTDILSKLRGSGPIAWRPDGTAIQVVVKGSKTVVIWDVRAGRLIREVTVPEVADVSGIALAALSRDGTTLAVAARTPDVARRIVAWETSTGECILNVPFSATAVAVSPLGELVAAGDADGNIRVWTRGRSKAILALPAARASIDSLAFGRDVSSDLDRASVPSEESASLLAVSDAGGRVTIWDLALSDRRTSCTGSLWDVSHIAFSPDGATLATGGRQKVLLWDIATGRLLLELPANDTVVGLEFSRDGERLAIAANDGRGNPAGLMVYDILERRGLQLLRGLAAPVIQVRFSSDGEYVTALSSDWQLAVWDAATGHLRRVLRVPRGLTADNAGFAVSPDGEQIAFATSRYAALRDIASGRVEREWKLKPGLQEQLAFHQSGRLLLVHVEARSGSPFGQRDRETDPLVCRIYDLFAGGDEPAPIAPDVTDFGRHVGALVFSPDGERFAVDGYYGPGAQDRAVACFATLSGNRLWSLPSEHTNRHGTSLFIDPTGAVVSVVLDDTIDRSELLDALTGKSIGHLPGHDKGSVGPGGWYALNKAEYGCHLLGRGAAVPLAKLGVDSASSSYVASFNAAGTHVAWGNADGTVTLSDIALLRRRLTSLSLDWADALAGGK